jgi:hypothetical protein
MLPVEVGVRKRVERKASEVKPSDFQLHMEPHRHSDDSKQIRRSPLASPRKPITNILCSTVKSFSNYAKNLPIQQAANIPYPKKATPSSLPATAKDVSHEGWSWLMSILPKEGPSGAAAPVRYVPNSHHRQIVPARPKNIARTCQGGIFGAVVQFRAVMSRSICQLKQISKRYRC